MASDRLLAPSISKATVSAALMVSASGVVTETSFPLRDRIGPAEDGSGGGAMRRWEEPSSPVNSIQNMPPGPGVGERATHALVPRDPSISIVSNSKRVPSGNGAFSKQNAAAADYTPPRRARLTAIISAKRPRSPASRRGH